MTKAEAFHQAWQLGMKADFSIVDEIYHPEYSSFDRSRYQLVDERDLLELRIEPSVPPQDQKTG